MESLAALVEATRVWVQAHLRDDFRQAQVDLDGLIDEEPPRLAVAAALVCGVAALEEV